MQCLLTCAVALSILGHIYFCQAGSAYYGVLMNAIVAEKLTKRFSALTAVDGVSFSVESGELFGLLGPNGAGKTTTINMLSTLLAPTSGRALVAGFDVTKHRDAVRRSIGVVFQEPALDSKLTGRENLDFHAMMYGLGRRERAERISEVLDLVDLSDRADVLADNYSGGMKRRLEIARGFVHRPQVLFLDEPTLGLDPQTRRHIWEYIRQLNREQRMTIILTTHYMEEADFLCDRIAIMDSARIVAMDTARRLKDVLGGDVVTLEIDGDAGTLARHLQRTAWVRDIGSHERCLRLTMEHAEKKIPELVAMAQSAGAVIESVELHKPSLEDVFLHFTGKTIRESDASSRERMRARMHGGTSR